MIRGGHVTLFVRDVGRAIRFYVETLGMKLVEETGDGWALIDAGDGFLLGLRAQPGVTHAALASSTPFAPRIALTPKVPLQEAIAIYENRGVVFDVRTEAGATSAHFADEDGNALSLVERAP